MTILNTILNIIQWKRLLYFSFIIFLAKFCFLFGFGFETILSFFDLLLFTVSCTLLYASTYLLSFYYNNKTKRKDFKKIELTSFLFVFTAIILGVYFSFKIDNLYFSIVFFIISLLVFTYSKYSKENSFTRYLVKSFAIPITIIFVLWLDEPVNLNNTQWNLFFKLQLIIVVYILLSFLNTLTEEIIKGIKNINKDNLKKLKTLPILLGRKRAKRIALAMMFTSALLITYLALYFIKIKFLFFAVILFNWLPRVYLIYSLIKSSTNKDYKLLLKKMRYLHFFGLLGIVSIAYYFKYVI
ncbi:UbiA family prenyltransferase [Tenacibaculum sp. AHE15PA]|uniref:UbiA family prenyltransferase n=1 Tax=unclassified Tenacibaculum TaxID=2635139 RepID=UPI001C4F2727|nr:MULTISPECIES: UbiA family prenyltransferase [unclassified Tenacibaculum]QXP73835.1 UbiA family prenyltransferase [Tenacibaculum sp. AHE14PA]QXP75798.1 UbiA family prenyltransferase [Tenacibaculum sp. AHE15PA]